MENTTNSNNSQTTETVASSDWRSQVADPKNFDTTKPYDYNKLINHFNKVKDDIEHINPYEFLAGTFELMKGFMKLGSALSMGFSDISSKVERWREIIIKDFPGKELNDLQSIMEKESNLKIHLCNGDNNSKLGFNKKTPYHSYISGTRTLLRLNWFLHFVSKTLRNMLETEYPFNKCIKNAYIEVLAPHHSWIVKNSVSVAMGFAGSKRGPALNAFYSKIVFINFIK